MGGDQGRYLGSVLEGRRAGQAFVEHAGQCVDVRAGRDLPGGKPFRREVGEGTDGGAFAGEFGVGGGVGQPEVDEAGEVVLAEQNVGRFDIAVDHRFGMGGIQRSGDLTHDVHRPRRAQRAVALERALQVGAVDEPHIDVELSVDLATTVDGHHVRVVQPAGGPGLAKQPFPERRIVRIAAGQQLQRHHPVHAGVFGFIDFAEPASAEQSAQ